LNARADVTCSKTPSRIRPEDFHRWPTKPALSNRHESAEQTPKPSSQPNACPGYMDSSCIPLQCSIFSWLSGTVIHPRIHDWSQRTHEDDDSKTSLSSRPRKGGVPTWWGQLPVRRQSKDRKPLAEVSNAVRIDVCEIAGLAVRILRRRRCCLQDPNHVPAKGASSGLRRYEAPDTNDQATRSYQSGQGRQR
jgi:hypothetical protein